MAEQQVVECDHEIEQLLGAFEPLVDLEQEAYLPTDRKRNRSGKKETEEKTETWR